MIVKLIPLLLVITLKTTRCSLVIDSIAQKGLYVSDYCPSMKYCREGSHVMCMYYDPNRVMGPRCSNAVNISISADLANQLLDVTNAIRSKVATGKESGKDGHILPRGYGIFRVRWDNELATFAQVLANQCVLRHDLCRATKRFPDPGQTAGLVRFTFPDWFPMSKTKGTSSPGLTNVKLAYAITQTLKSWYAQKTSVTEQMVKSYPDWTLTPNNQGGRLYLEMIFGSTTHMGCGMSAYAEYSYYDNQRQSTYNSIQVICNYSSRPRKGSISYMTEPGMPSEGYSAQCGCPPGSREDSDCLCNEDIPENPTRAHPEPTPCPNGDMSGNCEPTLVLLPIFTMEDAPPEKLYERAQEIKEPLKNFILQRIDNSSAGVQRSRQSMEMFDFFAANERKNLLHQSAPIAQPMRPAIQTYAPSSDVIYRAPIPTPIFPPQPVSDPPLPPSDLPPQPLPRARPSPPRSRPSTPFSRPTRPPPPPPPYPPPPPPQPELPPIAPPLRIPPPTPVKPPPPLDQFIEVLRTRNEHDKAGLQEQRRRPLPRPPPQPMPKKASIFTRVAQFKLPGRKSMSSPFQAIKKDVPPRKDFSNLHKVVNDYLNRRPGFRRVEESQSPHTVQTVTDTGLNRAEEKVINYNQYLKQKSNITNHDKDIDVKDDNDNKLMSLLDNLEREVKNIALDGSEKELFDAKIRKIYGSLVGKYAGPNPSNVYELEAAEIDIGQSKSIGKLELDHLNEEEKNPDEHKNHLAVEKKIVRAKNYDYLVHKRNDKFSDRPDQKKYNDNIDQNVYDRKYDDIYDHKYGMEHKYMDDVDHKYSENLVRKYSENHLDHKYNDVNHKITENFDKKYHYNIDRKYDDNVPASRNLDKYENNKDILEFKEYKHNPQSSAEDNIKYRNFDKYSEKDLKNSHSTLDRNSYRGKDSERKHRNRADAKIMKSHLHNDLNDPLSLERRKYYQEKLDNIERKLRGSRNNRRRMDPRNERPMRRMRPNREGGISRTRSKSQADNFYMPERARFLHGF